MQLDHMFLANAIQTSDALFQKVRVRGQVEQHQMVGELKVAAFAADFRAESAPSAGANSGVSGEVGRCPVAFENAQALVKHAWPGCRNATRRASLDPMRGFRVGADHPRLWAYSALAALALPEPDGLCFIDTNRIPSQRQQCLLGLWIADQPFQGPPEPVACLRRGVSASLLDKASASNSATGSVEAPTHFHQPLCCRFSGSRMQHTVAHGPTAVGGDHQAGFDGCPGPTFVRQPAPWRDPVGDLRGNVCSEWAMGWAARAAQPPEPRLQLAAGMFRVCSQGDKQCGSIARRKAVAGQTELDEIRQLGFRQGDAGVLRVEPVHRPAEPSTSSDFAHGHFPAYRRR
ncbi:hypothetical protein FQR65_LT17933 [Abscondita terminalis]|nr:hypothetical protein FQR65_LT17933 [Abscondita terminalis]